MEDKLERIINRFISDKRIYSPETIYQADRVIEGAYELIEELCDVLGYYREDD